MTEYFEKTAENRSHVILASSFLIVELLQIREKEEQKRENIVYLSEEPENLATGFPKDESMLRWYFCLGKLRHLPVSRRLCIDIPQLIM